LMMMMMMMMMKMRVRGAGGGWVRGTRGARAARVRASVRDECIDAIRPFRRGEGATARDRSQILNLLERLEDSNACSSSEIREQLQGSWILLYQAPVKCEEDLSAYEKRAVTVEGPFLSAFKPLTKGLFKTLSNTQNILVDEQKIENIAEFRVASRWRGKLNIAGQVVLGEDKGEGSEETRKAYVTFSSFSLSLEGLEDFLTIPIDKVLTFLGKDIPKGYLLTTYMDEDLRVGRGDKGSIFVAKRMNKL